MELGKLILQLDVIKFNLLFCCLENNDLTITISFVKGALSNMI